MVSGLIFVAIAAGAMAVSEDIGGIVTLILYIPFVWISLAVNANRWHDRDKSAWWILIGLVPIAGGIWAFVECGCLRGTMGDNTFGPDPT